MPRGEDKPKSRKTKFLARNLTKTFKGLVEERRNSITTTAVKTLKMKIDMKKTRKVFQMFSKLRKSGWKLYSQRTKFILKEEFSNSDSN